VLEPAIKHHLIDASLNQIGRSGSEVPVILKRHRPHLCPGGIHRDLKHVLRALDKVRKRVDVVVDRTHQELILDSRVDRGEGRIVLQHLIEVRTGIELTSPLYSERTTDHSLTYGCVVPRMLITHQ
jgi:hypothetical protein